MICKFFENKKGESGGTLSINYLLNPQRVKNHTAKILKGDESLTREIIQSLNFKQKACVGCLSFEEKNIDENIKKEIMENFENALLTPEMQSRYNILWVEHTDKGRLELNFVIPKIDLETKKSFNPYYHKVDFKRVDLCIDLINLTYGFTNPKDPAKEQNIKNINHHAKTFKDHKALHEHFKELAINGLIKNRDELIKYIETDLKEVVKITRKSEDYLSLKLENDKKATRYKGELYKNGDYGNTFAEENARKQREARELSEARDAENIERLREELRRSIDYKARFIRRKYDRETKFLSPSDTERNIYSDLEANTNNFNTSSNNYHNSIFLASRTEPNAENLGKIQRNNHHTEKSNSIPRRHENLHQTNDYGGLKNGTYERNFERLRDREREFNTVMQNFTDRERELNERKQEFNTREQEFTGRNNKLKSKNRELERKINQLHSKLTESRVKNSLDKLQYRVERIKNEYDSVTTELTRQRSLAEFIRGIAEKLRGIADRALKRRRNFARAWEKNSQRFKESIREGIEKLLREHPKVKELIEKKQQRSRHRMR